MTRLHGISMGRAWRKTKAALQRLDVDARVLPDLEGIAQRQAEIGAVDLEHIALFGPDAVGEGQGRGAEHMDMDIARLAEELIFEVMMLEIGEAVRHVR